MILNLHLVVKCNLLKYKETARIAIIATVLLDS